jgi:hypothetical protein
MSAGRAENPNAANPNEERIMPPWEGRIFDKLQLKLRKTTRLKFRRAASRAMLVGRIMAGAMPKRLALTDIGRGLPMLLFAHRKMLMV